MLRFNFNKAVKDLVTSSYFNTSYVTVQRIVERVQKVVHLDFNTSYVTVQRQKEENKPSILLIFQYILCYGSTGTKYPTNSLNITISIHPMLRFNNLGKM